MSRVVLKFSFVLFSLVPFTVPRKFSYILNSKSSRIQNATKFTKPFPLEHPRTPIFMGRQRADDQKLELDSKVFCKFQPNGYDCDNSDIFVPKFFYDIQVEKCMTYHFGQCKGELNMFDSIIKCYDKCSAAGLQELQGKFSAKTYCRFQPDFGKCNNYEPKFYYDITTRSCKGFAYSGCGGNLNRFDTYQVCMVFCTGSMVD